jgi:hypothetical protein
VTWIIIIAVGGGATYYAARYAGALVFVAAVAVVLVPITALAMFVNDITGLSTFLPAAGEAIAGVSSTTEIPGECPPYTEQTWWSVLLGLVLGLLMLVGGIVAVFGAPTGIVVTAVGALKAIGEGLFRGNTRAWLLRLGLTIFAVGMVGIVLFGLAGRVAVYSASDVGCASIFPSNQVSEDLNRYRVRDSNTGNGTVVYGSLTNRGNRVRGYEIQVEYWLDRNGQVQYAPGKDPKGQPYFTSKYMYDESIAPGETLRWEMEIAPENKKGLVRKVRIYTNRP